MDNENDKFEDGEMDMETEDVVEVDEPDAEVNPAADFLDMVIDGKGAEAKDALHGMLYQRIGDRIDAMKTDLRTTTWGDDAEDVAAEDEQSAEAEDVPETPEEEV
jgi:hypothetical protein